MKYRRIRTPPESGSTSTWARWSPYGYVIRSISNVSLAENPPARPASWTVPPARGAVALEGRGRRLPGQLGDAIGGEAHRVPGQDGRTARPRSDALGDQVRVAEDDRDVLGIE